MKLVLGIIIIGSVGVFVFYKLKKNPNSSESELNTESQKPVKFFSLNDGNQNELIISAEVTKKWLDSIKTKYDWNNFDEYDNRTWEYMSELFDRAVYKYVEEKPDVLWNKLNREQKVFWAFLAFNGDTDNGGVYQFIFNRPEFIIAIAEMWEELGMEEIGSDYEKVLKELSGKTGKLNELNEIFNDESQSWNKRWNSFADGYKELKSTKEIEDYYYDKEFKKKLFKKVADYIELNINKFTKLEQ